MKLVEFSNNRSMGTPCTLIEGVKGFPFNGGVSLIGKAAVLKTASNRVKAVCWFKSSRLL